MRPALAALALAALDLVCLARAAWPLTTRLFPEITLIGNVPQTLPDTATTLTLTRVEDQRWPAGVDCLWAGMIRVTLTVTTATGADSITLCNRCDGASDLATAAGLTFGLVDLAPSTEALATLGRDPVLADYALTLNHGPAD